MKKLTIKEKLLNDIDQIISNKLSLTHLPEFEGYNRNYFSNKVTLFIDRPELWTELEIAICDYTMRIKYEMLDEIQKLLIK